MKKNSKFSEGYRLSSVQRLIRKWFGVSRFNRDDMKKIRIIREDLKSFPEELIEMILIVEPGGFKDFTDFVNGWISLEAATYSFATFEYSVGNGKVFTKQPRYESETLRKL